MFVGDSLKMKWALVFLLGSSLAEIALGWSYHTEDKRMKWKHAREWCRSNYTDIVVIRSQAENDYLVSLLPNKEVAPYYWIGITKSHENDTWTWVGDNSTWIGEHSWAANEPSEGSLVAELCVELYVNTGENRGKWNNEKCSSRKYPVCYKSQCNSTSCNRGKCLESIGNITCLCDPGFEGDRCQTVVPVVPVVECPPLSQPHNGQLSCSGGNRTFNSTCQFKCNLGFLMIGWPVVTCGVTGLWSGPRPVCASYKQALMAMAGCGALSAFCCICFCWMKRRKRKKLAQVRLQEEALCSSSEAQE